MKLNELSPAEGSQRPRNESGEVSAPGWGKTAGRGTKGQGNAPAEVSGLGMRAVRCRFIGGCPNGALPISSRKISPSSIFGIWPDLTAVARIDEVELVKAGLIKGTYDGIKLLGQGEIDYPLQIKVNAISKSAQEKISAAGGTVEVV
jgi:large subunit ribosomal protein L15